jgi:type VI secretion system protein ImpL
VAGPFTANGWEKISAALRSPAPWPVEAEVERWAIDDATLPADEAGLRQSVRQRYFEDYAEHWLHFLSELALKAPADTAGAKDELTALQEGDGFFKTLFSQFKVNVVHDEDAAGAPDAGGILSRIFGKTDVDAAARSVVPPVIEKSFRPILGFAGMLDDVKTTGPAPLEKYLSVLEKLKAALDEPPAPDATAAAQQAPFRQAQAAVTELLDSVSEPTRAALSRLLMPPILGAVSAGTGGVVGSISADWKSTVWTAWDEKLSSRYPFRPSGEAANFQDFDTFFKPDGLLWKFVGKNLGDLVEERGDGKYVPKRGADATLTPEGLSCLTIAAEITEAFYRPDPGMKLSVQADWTAPNVTDAKFFVGAKETSLPKAQWSQVIKWFGEDVHVDWQEDGRPTQELGRHSFSLFDLFVHLGGLRQTSGPPRTVYAVDCPPLTLKVKPEGSVDALAPGFFSRLRCPPEIRATKP